MSPARGQAQSRMAGPGPTALPTRPLWGPRPPCPGGHGVSVVQHCGPRVTTPRPDEAFPFNGDLGTRESRADPTCRGAMRSPRRGPQVGAAVLVFRVQSEL